MKRSRSLVNGSSDGFTLIEVVVALGILVFGVLAVARIFPVGKTVVESAHSRTAAANLAEKILREFQSDPLLLPVSLRQVEPWNNENGELENPCVDPRSIPEDSQQIYQDPLLALNPCGIPPRTNGIETTGRIIGESKEVNVGEDYPGFVMIRFPPAAFPGFPPPDGPVLANVTNPPGDPDDVSVRAYVDVTLQPMPYPEPPIFASAPPPPPGFFRYVPEGFPGAGGPGIPNPGHVLVGLPVIPAILQATPMNYRVFRCSYRWRVNNAGNIIPGPDYVVNERHFAATPPNPATDPWVFVLERPPIGDNAIASLTSLTVVEEVDQSFRIDLTPGVPLSNGMTGLINFWAGDIPGANPPSSFIPAIQRGTRVKFDYSIPRDPNDAKRSRWITERGEVPNSGVFKLSIRPILEPNPASPIPETLFVTDAGSGRLMIRGTNPTDDYDADFENGEVRFNTAVLAAKTPVQITYRPAQDWIVQIQRASQTYVPYYAAVPDIGSPQYGYAITMAASPNFRGGWQSYRSYRAYNFPSNQDPLPTAAMPYREIGFHISEVGKTVAVDYIDAFGVKHLGEVHTIHEPLAGPRFGTPPRPHQAQIELAAPYATVANPDGPGMILKVAGTSVRVRVLWGEKNAYRKVEATGTVGPR